MSVFLVAGISGCYDWQADMLKLLANSPKLTCINPRLNDFGMVDPKATNFQFEWAFSYLSHAKAVLFWFPKETLCPITRYELGLAATMGTPIFMGCDPDYLRVFDVTKNLALARPEVVVRGSLVALAADVSKWAEQCQY